MDHQSRTELRRLVKERGGLVNAHSHLDIARTMRLPMLMRIAAEHRLERPERLGELPLEDKIYVLDSRLRNDAEYRSTLYERVAGYLNEFAESGGRSCRTCVTLSAAMDTGTLDVFTRLKREFAPKVALQIAALQLLPILNDQRELQFFRELCERPEIDLVSGLPQHHPNDTAKYVAEVFDIALRTNKPIEIHADEYLNAGEEETAIIAAAACEARERGFAKAIAVVHCITLSAKPPSERRRVSRMLAAADVTVVTCPRSAISIARKDVPNYLHNAIAPVRDMLECGVRVAVGTDNINDVFLPLSSGDLYAEIEMLAESQRFYDLRLLADMLTTNGAKALET